MLNGSGVRAYARAEAVDMRKSGVVGADDTTLLLAAPGRGKTRSARLWAYRGGEFRRDAEGVGWQAHAPAVVFEFTESREGRHPMRFLAGYRGYLQADAYAGFDALYRDGGIVEVACWVHYLERRFMWSGRPATASSAPRRRGHRRAHKSTPIRGTASTQAGRASVSTARRARPCSS